MDPTLPQNRPNEWQWIPKYDWLFRKICDKFHPTWPITKGQQKRAVNPRPDEVVEGLYISDVFTASGYLQEVPRAKGAPRITHMISILTTCCAEQKWIERTTTCGIVQKHIHVSDCKDVQFIAHFPEICQFIHEALRGPAKVLIHCRAGRSRSAAAMLAYLMWSQHMILDEAYALLRSKRAVVCANPGFLKQLSPWQTLDCDLIEPPMDRCQAIKTLHERFAALNALAGMKPCDIPEGDRVWHTDWFWKSGAPMILKALYPTTILQQQWRIEAMTRKPSFDALSRISRPAKPIKAHEEMGDAREEKSDAQKVTDLSSLDAPITGRSSRLTR